MPVSTRTAMRIAYVCADRGVPVFGSKGASVHVRELIRAFLGMGAKVELAAARTGGPPTSPLRDVAVHLIPGEDSSDPDRSIRSLLEDLGPFDLVYERYSLWSTAAMTYASEHGIPAMLEVNAPLIAEHRRYRGDLDHRRAEECAARAFSAAGHLLAVSHPVAGWVKGVVGGVRAVTVLPNGVDTQRFKPHHRRDDGRFTIGFTGSLKPWHGVGTLLQAAALLMARDPSVRLLIVGDGPQRQDLEAAAAALAIDGAVEFAGAVEHEKVPAQLARMDVAVAPYPDLPGFYFSPLKLFEYLASGLPVVASRVGQVAEIVEHGVTGVLCPPGDPVALADAMHGLRRDPEMRQALGRAGRDMVVRRHTWDRIAGEVLRIAGLPVALTEAC